MVSEKRVGGGRGWRCGCGVWHRPHGHNSKLCKWEQLLCPLLPPLENMARILIVLLILLMAAFHGAPKVQGALVRLPVSRRLSWESDLSVVSWNHNPSMDQPLKLATEISSCYLLGFQLAPPWAEIILKIAADQKNNKNQTKKGLLV